MGKREWFVSNCVNPQEPPPTSCRFQTISLVKAGLSYLVTPALTARSGQL